MPYAERAIKCCDCGATFYKRCNPSGEHRCLICAINRMVDAVMQMHQKSGPTWDAWRAGVRARLDLEDARAEAARLRAEHESRPFAAW